MAFRRADTAAPRSTKAGVAAGGERRSAHFPGSRCWPAGTRSCPGQACTCFAATAPSRLWCFRRCAQWTTRYPLRAELRRRGAVRVAARAECLHFRHQPLSKAVAAARRFSPCGAPHRLRWAQGLRVLLPALRWRAPEENEPRNVATARSMAARRAITFGGASCARRSFRVGGFEAVARAIRRVGQPGVH